MIWLKMLFWVRDWYNGESKGIYKRSDSLEATHGNIIYLECVKQQNHIPR